MVTVISIEGEAVKGIFKERSNRFLALVNIQGTVMPCYLPNPGRMNELLAPGTEVLLTEASKEYRKTHYDLIGVFKKDKLVSIDSRVPNKLVLQALKNGDIEEFYEYYEVKPEYGYHHSIFDFFLENEREECLLEVKSCTLVKDGVALFPDAVTGRGRRHVRDLAKAKEEGYRACILFIVQRTDAHVFTANDETDPDFGSSLREANSRGVEVYAYRSELAENSIKLDGRIEVKLRPS